MHSPAEDLFSYIRSLDEATIRGIAREGTNYPNLVFVIVNLIRRLERTNITLSYEVITKEELAMFNTKLSVLSTQYAEYPSFHSQMTCFRNHRATLINKLRSSACELDRNSFRIAIVRLLSYTAAIISSLKLGAYLGGNLKEYSLKISPFLTLSVRYLFIAASYFGPMCLITSFAEYLRNKFIVHCLINVIEEDKTLFMQVSNSNLEKDFMQYFFTELFSQTTDEDIIKNIKDLMSTGNLTSTEKIFATILVSRMKNNRSCILDGKFLYKTYLFSSAEAAEVWFNRLSYYIDPADKENDIRVLEEGLLHLKMIQCTSSLPAESFIILLKPSILPRVFLSGLHGLCFFYEIRKFKRANKCMLANDLRKLALNSQNVLTITRPALGFRR